MEMQPTYGQYVVPTYDKLVNFGVGQPCNDELPLDIIKRGVSKILDISDKSLLQYGDIPGYHSFRKTLSYFLENRYSYKNAKRLRVRPNELFITNGVTGAVSLLCSILKNKYNIKKVYVEEPTYFLMINIFKEFGLEIETISLESDGLNLIDLEKKLESDQNETKLLYTIPSFHNPTSITMSKEKRIKVSELSNKYNMIILADEVYQLLHFKEEDKPFYPLHYYGGKTYSISSFSKILAPSLRLGWIQAKPDLLKPLIDSGQLDSSGGINPFISRIVHNIIESGDMDNYLDKTKAILAERCRVLSEQLSAFNFNVPKGGYFIWINLGFDSHKFLEFCSKNKVKFHTGDKFSSNSQMKDHIRLSFSFYDYIGLKVGAERLTACLKQYKNIDSNNNNDNTTINVSLHGYTGRLGSKIIEHIELDSIKSDNNDKPDNNEKVKLNLFNKLGRDFEKDCELSGVNDIIVDVSRPDALRNLLIYLIQNRYNTPLLIGTTGDLPYRLIGEYCKNAPVAVISNFSYGIPSLLNILKKFDTSNWKISMQEIHHIHKLDKPSGTAKTLAQTLNYNGEIESIREGEEYGTHVVKLENENEEIMFKHKAKTRDIFASGSLRFIRWIVNQNNGLYFDMDEGKVPLDSFERWSGCGNTFGIIERSLLNEKDVPKYSDILNVDGIITFEIEDKNSIYDFNWIYYNRDGSCVEMCGNGARCVSKCVSNKLDKSHMRFFNNFNIDMECYIDGDLIKVSMPHWENYTKLENGGYMVNVGVPHIIILYNEGKFQLNGTIGDISDGELSDLFDKWNNFTNKRFGHGTNVSVIDFDSTDKVYIRTFERGVNRETGACGTACCAAHYMFRFDDNKRYITSSGEEIQVKYDSGTIWLSSTVNRF